MSEKEFKSYRFNDKTDPTDEHLEELMRKGAVDASLRVNRQLEILDKFQTNYRYSVL